MYLVAVISICKADSIEENEKSSENDVANEQITRECIENYLRSKNLLDRRFRSKKYKSNRVGESCDVLIADFKNDFYESIEKDFEKDSDFANETKCLMDHYKKYEVADLSMKYVFYDTATMSKRKRKKAMKMKYQFLQNVTISKRNNLSRHARKFMRC